MPVLLTALMCALTACAPLPSSSGPAAPAGTITRPAIDRVTWDGGNAVLEPDTHGTGYRLRASNGAEALLASSQEPPRFDHLVLVQGHPLVMVAVHDNTGCPHSLIAYRLNGRFWERYQLGNCGTTVTYEPTPTGLTVREQVRPDHNHAVWTLANGTWDVQSNYTSASEMRAAQAQERANVQARAAAAKPVHRAIQARLQTPSAVNGPGGRVDARRYQPTPGRLTLGD